MAFTAHNIELPDGSRTMDTPELLKDSQWLKSTMRVLRLIYGSSLAGKSIADLGCLEGGYAAEFARHGMHAMGIEVRQTNFQNCERVREALALPNLVFSKDDVWNLPAYCEFDAIFCCGLLYHLDRPVEFMRMIASRARDAVILNTHYARPEQASKFGGALLTTNEGQPGQWFREHDEDDLASREALKWASWDNKKSFWLTKPALLQTLSDCGFDLVFEQVDVLGPNIRQSMETGYYRTDQRSMFVGIRTQSVAR